jgi:hypothetical protein
MDDGSAADLSIERRHHLQKAANSVAKLAGMTDSRSKGVHGTRQRELLALTHPPHEELVIDVAQQIQRDGQTERIDVVDERRADRQRVGYRAELAETERSKTQLVSKTRCQPQ